MAAAIADELHILEIFHMADQAFDLFVLITGVGRNRQLPKECEEKEAMKVAGFHKTSGS
jgi:hypothetical protein